MNQVLGTSAPGLEWQPSFDAMGDYVCLIDTQSVVVRANLAAQEDFNDAACRLAGQPFAQAFGLAPGPSISASQIQQPTEVAPFRTEIELASMAGSYEVSIHPVDSDGMRKGAIAVLRNLTQCQETEASLRRSRRRYHSLVEQAPVAIYETDPAGLCTYVNAMWRQLSGLTQSQALGTGWQAALHPDDEEKISEAWRLHSKSGAPWNLEYRFLSLDGEITWVMGKSQALFDPNKVITGYLGVNVDITERKRAEQEKLDLERQVQRAEKLESLSQLAGGIAHDFNNILMIIEGNADLARDAVTADSMVFEHLDEIARACTNAAGLANQMLAYSGKGRFVNDPTDLSQLVRRLDVRARTLLSAKIALTLQLSEDLQKTVVDATQVRQLIISLVTNAAEAIGDDDGTITIRTGMIHCDGAYLDSMTHSGTNDLNDPLVESDYVYLEVTDTGCGMDEQTIAQVFDPFFTRKFTGRGLGLSAVLGIARGHRAGLEIDSEVGQGTRFRVLFAAETPVADEVVVYAPQTAKPKSERTRPTILMVDDDESVRMVSRAMLKHMGFDVVLAEDGVEGVQVVRNRGAELALVLLDLTMPRMNGEEAFREIRKLQPNLAVVLCSGYTEQQATREFTDQPLAGFMQKPFGIKALRAKIGEVLAGT